MVKLALPILVLMMCLLAVQATGLFSQQRPVERQFSQQVNLAMRQAADHLLDLAGDSTSTIPPVEEVSAGEFLLRLENHLNYDSLPNYLEQAIAQFGIQEPYYVTVNDCLSNLLVVGYSQENLKNGGQVACGGREHKVGCYNLTLVFPERRKPGKGKRSAWLSLAALVTVAIATGYFVKGLKTKELPPVKPADVAPNSSGMKIGNTSFDPNNLTIETGGFRQQLTFRETKLLQFFAERPNQVLERDAILAAVWEDEGVIVGRSLDVFVSRLRKILQKDPSLKITNVHGVGYRLEIEKEA